MPTSRHTPRGAGNRRIHREQTPGPFDANGDKALDVIASFKGRVSLFLAPDWREIVIHRFPGEGAAAIHSEVIDADGDGDTDAASCGYESKWVRWYEHDGKGKFTIHTLDDNQESYDLRTVDMDGDGDGDLLNAGRGSGNVVWYENLPTKR